MSTFDDPPSFDDLAEAPEPEPRAEALASTRRTPDRLQRLAGTLAVVSLVIVGTLYALSLAAPGAPAPTATPTPTASITPWPIPDEARTKVYTSTTPASGEFRTAAVSLAPTATAKATNTYAVRVETSANVDPAVAARAIQKTLDDPRGWAGFGNNNFQLVADAETAKLTITIASPTTTEQLCGPAAKTEKLWSCRVKNQVVINSDRWHFMVPSWNNLDDYRAYQVNHFVGQFLGQRIAFCQRKGEPAPAMAKQETNLDGCQPNPWPKLG